MNPAVKLHDDLAGQWDAKYRKPAFQLREKLFLSGLEGAAFGDGTRWLDAGCGTGRLAWQLAARGCRVDAVDASPAMLAAARIPAGRPPTDVPPTFGQVETVESLPFPDGTFDGVVCSSVIEYLDDPEAAIAELARVLKPGGRLVVSVPYKYSTVRRVQSAVHRLTARVKPISRLQYLDVSKNEFSKRGLTARLGRHGLNVVRTVFFGGSLPLPLQQLGITASLILAVASKRQS